MLILGVSDIDSMVPVPTTAGFREVMTFQGRHYLFQQVCQTSQEASQLCDLNFRQGSVSVILRPSHRVEVWVRAKQQDTIGRLLAKVNATSLNQKQDPTPRGGARVIYVDDSLNDGQRMKRILAEINVNCTHISDPLRALPTLIEQKPELIFLDLVMTNANGYEICSQIRRINQLKEIPVIMLTSSSSIVNRARAKLVGLNDFVAKPFDRDTIHSVLSRYNIKAPAIAC